MAQTCFQFSILGIRYTMKRKIAELKVKLAHKMTLGKAKECEWTFMAADTHTIFGKVWMPKTEKRKARTKRRERTRNPVNFIKPIDLCDQSETFFEAYLGIGNNILTNMLMQQATKPIHFNSLLHPGSNRNHWVVQLQVGIAFIGKEIIPLNQSFQHVKSEAGMIRVASVRVHRWRWFHGRRLLETKATIKNPFTTSICRRRRWLWIGVCPVVVAVVVVGEMFLAVCTWKEDQYLVCLGICSSQLRLQHHFLFLLVVNINGEAATLFVVVMVVMGSTNRVPNLGNLCIRIRLRRLGDKHTDKRSGFVGKQINKPEHW